MDENEPTAPKSFLNEDLSAFSVEEIEARIAALDEEIRRCKEALTRKRGDMVAAEAIFSSKKGS